MEKVRENARRPAVLVDHSTVGIAASAAPERHFCAARLLPVCRQPAVTGHG